MPRKIAGCIAQVRWLINCQKFNYYNKRIALLVISIPVSRHYFWPVSGLFHARFKLAEQSPAAMGGAPDRDAPGLAIPRNKLLRQAPIHATLAGFGMDTSFYWSVLIFVVKQSPAQS
ncbi:hypothetical protein HSX11_27090 [Oxalobacteraceae bacterium]|nr:hypothetical protein [Oxalobacteraceae bacterium]